VSERAARITKIALEIAVPVALVLGWQAWTASADSKFFPTPLHIADVFQQMWLFDQFGTHVVPSLERIAMGYGIAVILGIGIGIPLGLSSLGRLAAMPLLEFFRNMPPPAMLPIFLILFGIYNTQKVAIIAFFCFFPVLLNTISGVRGIEPTLIETARSYGVPQRERIRRIVVPGASPQIAAGMRNSLALAVIIMVLAEYYSSTAGVGYVLLISKNTFQFDTMWATILLIGILGYLLNLVFLLAERRVLAWHRGWRASTPQ
jgi:ABC-type nitrate/sulfonate/bicarbonate transport system permease component